MNQLERTLTSLEVAEMVGRDHKNVLPDIRGIIANLGELNIQPSTYFIESSYKSAQNKQMPCYLLTKQGCELYGNRMTGIDGTAFSVKYIDRFNEMEQIVQKPMTPSELALLQAQNMVALEKRVEEQGTKIEQLEAQQDNITEIIKLNPTEWRKKTTTILNKIAVLRGGFGEYRNVRNESYEKLEERAKCRLNIRLENRKKTALSEGTPRHKVEKYTKLDAIADDARLTEIYLAIVKEMAIAHKVNAEGLGA